MTAWSFADPAEPTRADFGPGTLGYWDSRNGRLSEVDAVRGSASAFSLPEMSDGDPAVLMLSARDQEPALRMLHHAPANGTLASHGWTSSYTLIFDVLYPSEADARWRPLYQTDESNTTQAELYVEDRASGGIGTSSWYHGAIEPNRWHRIAVVVRAADREGTLDLFIDGRWVGGHGNTMRPIGRRWALADAILLFADDVESATPVFLSSLRFDDHALTFGEVEALGGSSALGATTPGVAPAAPARGELRRATIIAHRGASCCAPENTLVSIDRAFDLGADGVEIDVRLTSDGVPMLHHDKSPKRTTGHRGKVSEIAQAELSALDAGSWFGPDFAGEPIPTLEAALARIRDRGIAYLDVKDYGAGPAIARAVAAADFPAEDLWIWSYGEYFELPHLREALPGARFIWGRPPADAHDDSAYWEKMTELGISGFDIPRGDGNPSQAEQAFIKAAKRRGYLVCVHTLLDLHSLSRALEHPIDCVETNHPREFDRAMEPR